MIVIDLKSIVYYATLFSNIYEGWPMYSGKNVLIYSLVSTVFCRYSV